MNKKDQEPQNQPAENSGRRKAIKTLVGGVATVAAYNLLPGKWGTPVVESIFLPAHAATSGSTGQYGAESAVTGVQKQSPLREMLADLGDTVSDFLVPEAHALEMEKKAFDPYAFVTESTITFKFKYGLASEAAYECQVCSGPVSSSSFSANGSSSSFSGVTFIFHITSLTQESITFTISTASSSGATMSSSTDSWTFTRYKDSSLYSCSDVSGR